jgi:signal transduction histidine kinase
MFTSEDLRSLAILEGLPDEVLEWFCDHGTCVELDAGDHMFEPGDPADALWLVVDGTIQGFEEHGGQWLLVATTRRGEVTGMLPFSRMTHYPRYTLAAEPSRVLRLDASLFRGLLNVSEELGRRLVARMSDRVRGDVRLEQQSEKLMALGRLSAGLAHELNNPAAAVRRAAARLSEHRAALPGLVVALVGHHVSEEGLKKLERFRTLARESGTAPAGTLELSAREGDLADWLSAHGVEGSWEAAATFAEAGLTVDDLESMATSLPHEGLTDAIAWLAVGIESDRIVQEIAEAAGRMSEIVASIQSYSQMDRSTEHKPTDVREGLDTTLTMLAFKLKDKAIRLERDYQPDLPRIPANAGQLNQVWTNLIDNAVDAVEEGGSLTLRARRRDQWIEVEVEDNGPGIPEPVRARIFEPFFTTKEVGSGTGLGLSIARRIVGTHEGHIEVRSRPGETVLCVRLPTVRTSPLGRG